MKPFLKWAGNKHRVIHHIKNVLPVGKRLVEPFVGSGAVFLNTHFSEYLLADSNQDLITLYRTLQTEGKVFIDLCQTFFKAENNYKNIFCEFKYFFVNSNIFL
jgi:DNA adenine methylase